MQYIRLLHLRDYDKSKGRFTSICFRNSTNGGISVIEFDCAKKQSNGACQHIKKFYHPVPAKTPFIYWVLNDSDLTKFLDNMRLVQKITETGDSCHYDIMDVKNNKAEKFFDKFGKPHSNPKIYLCTGDDSDLLTMPIANYESLLALSLS